MMAGMALVATGLVVAVLCFIVEVLRKSSE